MISIYFVLYCVLLTEDANSSATTVTDSGPNSGDKDTPTPIMDTSSIIGLFIWFACVLYSSIRTSSNSQASRLVLLYAHSYFVVIFTSYLLECGINNMNFEFRLTMSDRVNLTEAEGGVEGGNATNGNANAASDDEAEGVTYNWSLFHIMFGLATLYIMMTLTNWYSPNGNNTIQTISANMSAVWVKIISSWLCCAIYVWTLIAPVVLPERDFSL